MRIVFLTSETTHHYFLINEIHKRYPVQKVFFQETYRPKKPWTHKLKTLLNFKKLRLSIKEKTLGVLFYKEKRQEGQYEKDVLFNGKEPFLDPSISHIRVPSFNHPETVKKVEAEHPDLIIVFGTEILRGKILNIAKKAILNIHRGIVPQYKGGGLPSWVLYNKDFDYLGVTVHLCTENLDSGDIVGQAFYRIQKDDQIYTLRGQTTILAAQLLEQIISDYAHDKVKYVKQGVGKTWTGRDLTVGKELIARKNLNNYLRSLKTG